MWKFRIFGIPVEVQPFFWAIALFLGQGHWDPTNWMADLAVWVAIVFSGVLIHELGHAIAGRAFGLSPNITLHGMGGLTAWNGAQRVSALRRMVIAFAGPAVGITLGGVAFAAARILPLPDQGLLVRAFQSLVWVNLGWGLVNLMPMLPLDGGNIMASGIELLLPRRLPLARLLAHGASLAVAVLIALVMLRFNQPLWNVFLLGLFAFANVRAVRELWPVRNAGGFR